MRPNFSRLIDTFAASVNSVSMEAVCNYVNRHRLSEEEICHLAYVAANSGVKLPFTNEQVIDFSSTGGPGSLSTLLCPLMLAAGGGKVVCIGVPGRPAGAVDVMAQIPGYDLNPNIDRVGSGLESSGVAHIDAGESYAPLDKALFMYRQSVGQQTNPDLVIASILSKKLAGSVSRFGLDIRIAEYGNFGKTYEEGKKNSIKMRNCAAALGVFSTLFLTDAERPYQPYFGRSESLRALWKVLHGTGDRWLEQHFNECLLMALETLSTGDVDLVSSKEQALETFLRNVTDQGGTVDSLREAMYGFEGRHTEVVRARRPGYIHVGIRRLRDVLTRTQKSFSGVTTGYEDPVGVILRCDHDRRVEKGDVLATIRLEVGIKSSSGIRQEIRGCLGVTDEPLVNRSIEVFD